MHMQNHINIISSIATSFGSGKSNKIFNITKSSSMNEKKKIIINRFFFGAKIWTKIFNVPQNSLIWHFIGKGIGVPNTYYICILLYCNLSGRKKKDVKMDLKFWMKFSISSNINHAPNQPFSMYWNLYMLCNYRKLSTAIFQINCVLIRMKKKFCMVHKIR